MSEQDRDKLFNVYISEMKQTVSYGEIKQLLSLRARIEGLIRQYKEKQADCILFKAQSPTDYRREIDLYRDIIQDLEFLFVRNVVEGLSSSKKEPNQKGGSDG